jgi:hypothetical protein
LWQGEEEEEEYPLAAVQEELAAVLAEFCLARSVWHKEQLILSLLGLVELVV